MIISGSKYLITTDEAMMMPDGMMYECIYGSLYIHEYGETFPFPVRGHVNYFFSIGSKELGNGVILVGGCRVRKAVQLDTPPPMFLSRPFVSLTKGPDDKHIESQRWQMNYFNADLYLETLNDNK